VDGIDVLMGRALRPANLDGHPRRLDHPDFLRAVRDDAAVAETHRKAAGLMRADWRAVGHLRKQGFRILAYGGDL
jgi:2-keto-3-deoxy-L-rhamnonate aldolase RhmA